MAALALVFSTSVRAEEPLAEVDKAERLIKLNLSVANVAKDIIEASRGAAIAMLQTGDNRAAACLDTLVDVAMSISDQIDHIEDLQEIRYRLVDARDIESAIGVRDRSSKAILERFDLERGQINREAGLCYGESIVQDKARMLLQLMDEATSEIEALDSK
jgi:hypothetical protein